MTESSGEGGYWRVAIVEDHLLQRQRTEDIINAQDNMRVVARFDTLPQFVEWHGRARPAQRPHLLLLDLSVDRGPSVDPATVKELIDSGLRVLVVSAFAMPSLVREILRVGVGGFVGKRDAETDLIAACWAVLERRFWMTPEMAWIVAGDSSRPRLSIQEERALVLYASGLTLASVAQALGVQPGTAKRYLARVKQKYEAAGRPIRTKVAMSHAAVADGYLDSSEIDSN